MSPILVRPVREQLEHDRVIRLLQADLGKKKVEVGINPGAEQNASVAGGGRKEFPDAVLYSTDKGRKLIAVVEVETVESVNHLEAMSQWAHLARLKVPFHLYVPTASVDVARRLSQDHAIQVTEIWSYHQVGEQFKFTLIYPPPGRGKAAGVPRTVSVASIRVEPRIDPTADVREPVQAAPAQSSPGAAVADKAKGTPARPRIIPAKTARASEPAKAAPPGTVTPKSMPSRAEPAKPIPAKAVPAKALPVTRPATKEPTAAKTGVKALADTAKGKAKTVPVKAAAPAKPSKPASGNGHRANAALSRPAPRPPHRAASPAARGVVPPRKAAPSRGKAAPRASKPSRGVKARPASPRKPASKRR